MADIDQTKQPFKKLLILDFEATCNEGKWVNEIIEFPTVVLDVETNKIVSEFHFYVKPEINPILTPFCIDLTGIQQVIFFENLKNGQYFLQ